MQSQYINVLIFSDADLERLYEQWEEDEEPLPVDELPEWDPRKPQPQVSRSQADISTYKVSKYIICVHSTCSSFDMHVKIFRSISMTRV